MKQNMPITWTRFFTTISFVIICSTFILSCKNNDTTTTTDTDTTDVVQPPCAAGKLYVCHLSSTDYLALKNGAGPGVVAAIVVQFTYGRNAAMPYSLIAYSARPGNRRYQADPANPAHPLTFRELTAFSEAPGIPATYVMGDQQIMIAMIDGLLAGAGNPANYTLTFTPEINGLNIRYKVCVINPTWCPDAGVYTNPSPPANVEP